MNETTYIKKKKVASEALAQFQEKEEKPNNQETTKKEKCYAAVCRVMKPQYPRVVLLHCSDDKYRLNIAATAANQPLSFSLEIRFYV